VSSFVTPRYNGRFGVASYVCLGNQCGVQPQRTVLYSTEPQNDEESSEALQVATETSDTSVAAPPQTSEPDGNSYPIDLPSPLLLSTSMILAIMGTGKDIFGESIMVIVA
jgi:hypothetical protein